MWVDMLKVCTYVRNHRHTDYGEGVWCDLMTACDRKFDFIVEIIINTQVGCYLNLGNGYKCDPDIVYVCAVSYCNFVNYTN